MTVLKIEERSLYWLAGLLEGEGCFITGKGRTKRFATIQLEMTDQDIVERAASLMGSAVKRFEPRDPTRQALYRTRVGHRRAVDLMLMLFPLMGKRRQEAITLAVRRHGGPLGV